MGYFLSYSTFQSQAAQIREVLLNIGYKKQTIGVYVVSTSSCFSIVSLIN